MLRLAALVLAVAACHPMMSTGGGQLPAEPYVAQAEAPAEQAVDTRTPGQIFVEILVSQGYTCEQQPTAWECRGASPTWQLYVSQVDNADGSSTIWFDSYLERAFAKRCGSFNNAMTDLYDQGNSFSASCDDSSRQFRFNTAVNYAGGLDVMAWVHAHETSRQSAAINLRSIKALSHDSARVIASMR
jgi:hypothetical protein